MANYNLTQTGAEVQEILDSVQTFDDTPQSGSTNPVTSEGINTALEGKQDNLTFDTTPTEDSTNPVTSDGVATALDEKADKDGYYTSLVAGAAETLVDTSGSTTPREFTFSTSGWDADIATGSAPIKKIRGNTLVWNQLITGLRAFSGSATISNNKITISGNATVDESPITTIVGHKYLVQLSYKSTISGDIFIQDYITSGSTINNNISSSSNSVSYINTASRNRTDTINIICSNYVSGTFEGYLNLFDLTLMFGSGNEPTTVAEFTDLFPLPYYAYNAGEILPFLGTTIQTTGFNQWDEEWELGSITYSEGAKVPNNNNIRSKNFIPVIPQTTYYIKVPTNSASTAFTVIVCGYDGNQNYVKGIKFSDGNSTFVTSADNIRYIKFCTVETGGQNYGSTYNNDICINLSWSGTKNGTYEPYELHTKDISFYQSLESSGTTLFANGMHGFDGYYDYASPTDAKQVITSQTVTGSSGDNITLTGCNTSATTYRCTSGDIGTLSAGVLTLTSDVSSIEVYYPLATPVEVTYDEVNLAYTVNDWGYEISLPENDDEPTTTPALLDVTYGLNIVDGFKNLNRNFLSQDDLDRLLTAMGTALGFTYTKTWDEDNNQWSFTITATETTSESSAS